MPHPPTPVRAFAPPQPARLCEGRGGSAIHGAAPNSVPGVSSPPGLAEAGEVAQSLPGGAVSMLVSREIAADGDRKRLRVTPMADGGWYVMMADGRNHASVSLSAAEFAFLFRLSSADAS